jgi:Ran GTPase-activating protein (RanGAP) involved in mRNA processing and transport
MLSENYTKEEKIYIAKKIKDISFAEVEEDMNKLIKIGTNSNSISERTKTGNNVVDYFTFVQRLETKGKYRRRSLVLKATTWRKGFKTQQI